MKKFYGSIAHVGCGNGCNAKFQEVLLDGQGQPIDVDWDDLRQIYDEHNFTCSTNNPFIDDDNAFYGNPDECAGFVIENEPSSGYRYCEF